MTILIVDDREQSRERLQTLLGNAGYPVIIAGGAGTADGSSVLGLGTPDQPAGSPSLQALVQTIRAGIQDVPDAALRESEARYDTFVNSLPDMAFLKDENYQHLMANKAFLDFLGKRKEEVIGKTDFELLPPELARTCRETDLKALACGDIVRNEETTHGGVYGSWKFRVRLANGQWGVAGFVRDITAQKRAEEARLVAEARYRLLFEQSPDGIVIIDPATARILEFNETAHRQLGYSREAFAGLRISDIEALETPEETQARIARVIGKGRSDFETRQRTRQGEIRYVHVTAQAAEVLGRPIYHCVWRDITERKQAETALRQSEERHRTVLQTALDGFCLTDLQGRLLEVNEAQCRMSGYSEQELLSMNIADLEAGQTPEEIRSRVQQVVAQGQARFESRNRCKDGSIRDVEVSLRYHPVEGGRLVGFLRDITERKRAEETRAKLEDHLRQAQKMEAVGRLAGGVAHDFNNMLQTILGVTELLLSTTAPDDPRQNDLNEIMAAARRSADLTRQLLAFARRQTIAPKVLDLNAVVADMAKMLSRLIGENIELVWKLGGGRLTIRMDPSQLDQILANLTVNAREAIAGSGKVTIKTGKAEFDAAYCQTHPDAVPGAYVMVAVSDNGCGMNQETLTHLFEPFFTTKPVGQGTGLGLATVYGIVRQNNGFIAVESAPGRGTTISIYLSRYTADEAVTPAVAEPAALVQGTETVLLVEDEALILRLARRFLEAMGYTVLTANTPGDALHLAAQYAGDIHLLLTDVVMPEIGGRELADRLHATRPKMGCLFMSGYTIDAIASRGVLDSGLHFIQKPFTKEDLAVKIRAALDAGSAAGSD